MNYFKESINHRKHLLYGAVVFIVVCALVFLIAHQQYLIQRSTQERMLTNRAVIVQKQLETVVKNCQTATKTLSFLVENYGLPEDFDQIAGSLLEGTPCIDAIQLLQKGVITHVFPRAGHEKVIGYDLLADTTRNKEAFRAIKDHKFYIAGPFNLRQGGVGVVGRYPIFKDHKFWGMTAVIVNFPELLKAAGMENTPGGGFTYQFSKPDPETGEEVYFMPQNDHQVFASTVKVAVPDGSWTLHIMPANPVRFSDNWALLLFGIICASLAAYLMVHLLDEPRRLSNQVAQKTAELREIAWMQSHRVRAPLARIMAISEILDPDHYEPERDRHLIEELNKSSTELDEVIRDIVKRTEPN